MIGQARIEHYHSLENTLLAYNSQDNYTLRMKKLLGKMPEGVQDEMV